MARIAVLHNTLDFHGGADAVCIHVCAALSQDHDVTLFTISETTLAELTAYFGVEIEGDVAVRSPPAAAVVARVLSTAAPWIGPQLAARSAVLARYVRPKLRAFDLAVGTTNELSLPIPSVQYIHVPQFYRQGVPGVEPERLNRLWSTLAAPPRAEDGPGTGVETTLLANSEWTADVTERIYGRRPEVLYPPVDPIPGDPWEQRENGVVFVGRLAPDKRVLAAIDILDRVRARDLDLHLHIVGSAPRAYRRYADEVAATAAQRQYVTLERDATRERLETLLGEHKFGLTTKEHEHFGMALAEYVAAGMVAFAPNSGGQRDVLGNRRDRLYDSTEEAATLLARAATEADPPRQPPDRFASDRFRRAFGQRVGAMLDRID